MKKNEKGFGAIETVIIIVVVVLLGFGGWYVWKQAPGKEARSDSAQQERSKPETSDVLKTFTSEEYGITLQYPKDWTQRTASNAYEVLKADFSSPDLEVVQLDNGYRIDAGGTFGLVISEFNSSGMDPAYRSAAEQHLGKSTIDSTADLLKVIDSGALEYISYTSTETIDGIAAGRGSCGHYVHGPCIFWVKNNYFYQVMYDGPSNGFAVKPDPKEIGKYSAAFETTLKSITLD